MTASFRSGSQQIKGCTVDRVLRVSTKHMPDVSENLGLWHWGESPDIGLTWIWAYEENCQIDGRDMPFWLLNLCIVARNTYGCNWICLDPVGDCIPDLPIYEH